MPEILTNFLFVQGVGVLALLFGVIAWNTKTRPSILKFQGVSAILFLVHYFLLGALAGAIMSGFIFLRNYIFVKREKSKWARHPAWLYLFLILLVPIISLNWQGWSSLLPVCGVLVGTYALSRRQPHDIRFYVLLTILFWIPYTIIVHSYSGLISQTINAIGIITGMVRLDKRLF